MDFRWRRTLRLLARNQQITIFTSEPLLLELETTLNRAKFQPQLQQRDYTVQYLMSVVKGFSTTSSTNFIDVPELRDPKDAKILETALGADAEAIVTGYLDLLILRKVEQIRILNPTDFINYYFPN